jgi:hypothetical protein
MWLALQNDPDLMTTRIVSFAISNKKFPPTPRSAQEISEAKVCRKFLVGGVNMACSLPLVLFIDLL